MLKKSKWLHKIIGNHFVFTLSYAVLIIGWEVTFNIARQIGEDIDRKPLMYLLIFLFGSLYLFLYFMYALEKIAESSANRSSPLNAITKIGLSIFSGILFFAINYYYIYSIDPSSFTGYIGKTIFDRAISFLYFSFVTFSTLGFGDIAPTSIISRVYVIEEIIYAFIIVVYILSSYGIFRSSFEDSSPFAVTNTKNIENEEKNIK